MYRYWNLHVLNIRQNWCRLAEPRRDPPPNFCVKFHCGLSLIFGVSSKFVQVSRSHNWSGIIEWLPCGMVWYGVVSVDLYSAIITKVSNALNTLVSAEKPVQAYNNGPVSTLCTCIAMCWQPFWPIGSGCARGFLGALDTAWMVRSWASGKMTPLEVIAERESVYQLLSQTTPENLNKSFSQHTIDPNTRPVPAVFTVAVMSTAPRNPGNLLEFEIAPENTGNLLEFSWCSWKIL